MAIPARASRPGTYFVTSCTFSRTRIFQKTANAELFIATLQHYRSEGRYKLHAFVVMPDHIHLILTPTAITLERAVGLIKGGFSQRLGSQLPVSQRGFTDHRIRDQADMETRRSYLHMNPVRAGLIQGPELYLFSSAYRLAADPSGYGRSLPSSEWHD